MNIIIGVRCQYWNRPEYIDLDLPDGISEEERESVMLQAAMQAAGLDFWVEEGA